MKTFYEIIGVEPNADLASIKSAYLEKVKQYHPDVYEGDKDFAMQKTAELTEAYQTLKDEELRKEYDQKMGISHEENINHNTQTTQTENAEEKQESNFFKDLGDRVGSFFKNMKSDFENFGKRHKHKKSEKQTKQKEKNQKKDENLSEENNEKPVQKVREVSDEDRAEKRDNVKRSCTIWILISIVILLIALVINVF